MPEVVEPVVLPIAAVPAPEPREPTPAAELDPELDLPTAVLPELAAGARLAASLRRAEPELAPEPDGG